MIPGGQAPRRGWPARRWSGVIAAIFAAQLGLIFWLSDRTPLRPRPAVPAPTLRLAGKSAAGLLELSDPTLFAVPHRRGFAGLAWLAIPQREYQGFNYSSPPEWLALSPSGLGVDFSQFIQTNVFSPSRVPSNPGPEEAVGEPVQLPPASERSELKIEDGLAQRRLATPLELPSWRGAELLGNSVVRMVVDAGGRPVSLALLQTNGLREADLEALARARSLRFAPVSEAAGASTNRLAAQSWGNLVFEWRTLPVTNGDSGKP